MLDEQVENSSASSEPEMTPEEAPNKGAKEKRERSSIQFPYGDLDDATAIAKAIHSNAGTSCSLNQLAAYLKQSPSSSAFRLRVACARIFGLTELDGTSIRLTETGKRVVDPRTEDEAKAHAFLAVPLYEALHKEYDGYSLPPPAALERKMNELGVSSKQTGKARQAFERSAKQAGFFAHGADRLVMPAFGGRPLDGASGPEKSHPRQEDPGKHGGAGGGGKDLHPFMAGLLRTLPEPETEWPIRDRVKWLRTASQIFGLIYEGEGAIKIPRSLGLPTDLFATAFLAISSRCSEVSLAACAVPPFRPPRRPSATAASLCLPDLRSARIGRLPRGKIGDQLRELVRVVRLSRLS